MQERSRFKQLGSLDTRLSSEAERLRKEARGIAVESQGCAPALSNWHDVRFLYRILPWSAHGRSCTIYPKV